MTMITAIAGDIIVGWAALNIFLLVFGTVLRIHELWNDIPKDERFWSRYDRVLFIISIGIINDVTP